jgi:hypothetical protein
MTIVECRPITFSGACMALKAESPFKRAGSGVANQEINEVYNE